MCTSNQRYCSFFGWNYSAFRMEKRDWWQFYWMKQQAARLQWVQSLLGLSFNDFQQLWMALSSFPKEKQESPIFFSIVSFYLSLRQCYNSNIASEDLPSRFKAAALLLLILIISQSDQTEYSIRSKNLLHRLRQSLGRLSYRQRYDRYSAADRLLSAYLSDDYRYMTAYYAASFSDFRRRAKDFYQFYFIQRIYLEFLGQTQMRLGCSQLRYQCTWDYQKLAWILRFLYRGESISCILFGLFMPFRFSYAGTTIVFFFIYVFYNCFLGIVSSTIGNLVKAQFLDSIIFEGCSYKPENSYDDFDDFDQFQLILFVSLVANYLLQMEFSIGYFGIGSDILFFMGEDYIDQYFYILSFLSFSLSDCFIISNNNFFFQLISIYL